MTTHIHKAELMLSLPVEDWDWLLRPLSAGTSLLYTERLHRVVKHLIEQLDRQKAALMSANKPEESRTQ